MRLILKYTLAFIFAMVALLIYNYLAFDTLATSEAAKGAVFCTIVLWAGMRAQERIEKRRSHDN